MATERQLRQRMQQLEAQIARLEQQNREVQQRITAQTEEKLRRMSAQLQQTYQRRVNETAEAYAARIRQFQEEMTRKNSEQLEDLRKKSEELHQKTRRAVRELEECNQELRDELKKLRDEENRRQADYMRAAQEAQQKAEEAKVRAEQTPHSFFCPQEFDIISEDIQKVKDLISSGMYQAAVSDAMCIELDFKLLRIKVEQAFSEWMQAFDDYRALLGLLYSQLRSFESRNLNTCAGSFVMKPGELNFWSCGFYADMAEKITGAYESFYAMDREQILSYLQEQAGTNRRAIYDLITQGRKWEDQLAAVMNCIVSERVFSDQRYVVADQVADALEELNYRTERIAFDPPDECARTQPWYVASQNENPLNSHDLSLLLGKGNRVHLRSVPRRQHGLTVQNFFYLTVDLTSSADNCTESQVAQEVSGYINQILEEQKASASVQYIPTEEDPHKALRERELLMSSSPSVSAQMRHLERKYP